MSSRQFVAASLVVALGLATVVAPTPVLAEEEPGDHLTAGIGRVPAADALIRPIDETAWLGDDVRGIRGDAQTMTRTFRRRGGLDALIRVDNETDAVATVTVRGTRGDADLAVRYTRSEIDITDEVVAGTFQIRDIAPGAAAYLRLRVKTMTTQRKGAMHHVDVTARAGSLGTGDTVRAVLDYPRFNADQPIAATLVNDTRSQVNRPALPVDFALSERAQTWSDLMAATGVVENSGMFWGLPARWRGVAEVVGVGSTLDEAHARLAADNGERLKMVSDWTQMGTGVTTSGGRTYVTYVFLLI